MEITETRTTCSRCGYKHAILRNPNDAEKKGEFFLCERCGYQKISGSFAADSEVQEYNGIGAFHFVSKKGVIGGGVFMEELFFTKLDEMAASGTGMGLKFMYTRKKDDGKYYLMEHLAEKEWEFGDDELICYEGLNKPNNHARV